MRKNWEKKIGILHQNPQVLSKNISFELVIFIRMKKQILRVGK